eukprot:170680_1
MTKNETPDILQAPTRKSKLPSEYDHYNKFRRKKKYTGWQLISGVFKDVFTEVSNKITNNEIRTLKLKLIGGFFGLGLLCGHTYSVYRGFTRLQLYSRHVLVGGGMGTLGAFPVVSFLNVKNKQFPYAYMIIRGGIFGSICGLIHRASYKWMLPYGCIGMLLHGFIIIIWDQAIKPFYYHHILSWPDYIPPKWWPSQHICGMELYVNSLEDERLNVTYPEDLEYFKKLDKEKEAKLQKRKQEEFEQEFVYHSEINEKQQLEQDPMKPKNMFGI